MKGMKLREKNGRDPRINPNSPTNRINVLPVPVITTLVSAPQDINPRQPPLVIMLVAQVSTITPHQSIPFIITPLSNIHIIASPQ